jgi:hypothetical protein
VARVPIILFIFIFIIIFIPIVLLSAIPPDE